MSFGKEVCLPLNSFTNFFANFVFFFVSQVNVLMMGRCCYLDGFDFFDILPIFIRIKWNQKLFDPSEIFLSISGTIFRTVF